ncbi:hypothetical protein AHAS_Ahas13G0341000 [Arachis hypogaea]
MTEDAAHILMPHVSEWNFVKEDSIFKLKRTRKVKTFTKGLEFFKIVADLAESEGNYFVPQCSCVLGELCSLLS